MSPTPISLVDDAPLPGAFDGRALPAPAAAAVPLCWRMTHRGATLLLAAAVLLTGLWLGLTGPAAAPQPARPHAAPAAHPVP